MELIENVDFEMSWDRMAVRWNLAAEMYTAPGLVQCSLSLVQPQYYVTRRAHDGEHLPRNSQAIDSFKDGFLVNVNA